MNFLEEKDKEGEEEVKMNILITKLATKAPFLWRTKKPCKLKLMPRWFQTLEVLIS